MGDRPCLDDLAEVDPELARGLHTLLEYEGEDFEAVFDRTFTGDLATGENSVSAC